MCPVWNIFGWVFWVPTSPSACGASWGTGAAYSGAKGPQSTTGRHGESLWCRIPLQPGFPTLFRSTEGLPDAGKSPISFGCSDPWGEPVSQLSHWVTSCRLPLPGDTRTSWWSRAILQSAGIHFHTRLPNAAVSCHAALQWTPFSISKPEHFGQTF